MIHDIFTQIDLDGDGTVELDELVEWYKQREGVGDLSLGQIEDAELARFCVSQLVHLVRQEGQQEAEKWSGLIKHDDEVGTETDAEKVVARKARWKKTMAKTKAALVVNDQKSSGGRLKKRIDKPAETDTERAARLMKSVIGRMNRSILDITFLAWAEHAKFMAGRTVMRFKCLASSTVRSGVSLTSPKVGDLVEGTEVEGFEMEVVRFGISRVKTLAGWVSDKFMDGRVILERIDENTKPLYVAKGPAEPERGTLIVKVICARGLPKMDLFGSVDGYATATCGNQEHKTGVVKKSRDPQWDKTMEFNDVSVAEEFHLTVFDHDAADADQTLVVVKAASASCPTPPEVSPSASVADVPAPFLAAPSPASHAPPVVLNGSTTVICSAAPTNTTVLTTLVALATWVTASTQAPPQPVRPLIAASTAVSSASQLMHADWSPVSSPHWSAYVPPGAPADGPVSAVIEIVCTSCLTMMLICGASPSTESIVMTHV